MTRCIHCDELIDEENFCLVSSDPICYRCYVDYMLDDDGVDHFYNPANETKEANDIYT